MQFIITIDFGKFSLKQFHWSRQNNREFYPLEEKSFWKIGMIFEVMSTVGGFHWANNEILLSVTSYQYHTYKRENNLAFVLLAYMYNFLKL